MIHIVLFEPQIPQNTGNIARTCAVGGFKLHLIEPLGFTINDKTLKRAGLTYWSILDVQKHPNFSSFLEVENPKALWLVTKFASQKYTEVDYTKEKDIYLLFGKETTGLPNHIHEKFPQHGIRIPMLDIPEARCLNLATSVGIVAYEVARQRGFDHLS